MNRRIIRHFHVILLVLTCLSACSGPMVKEDVPAADLFEVKRLADEAYQRGDMVESEKEYAILVKALPEEAEHWFRLANVYYRTQRPDAAISAYREAVIRDPKYAKAWYNMGVVQLREAINSLGEMQTYSDPEDPMSRKGKYLLDGIIDLLDKDNPEQ